MIEFLFNFPIWLASIIFIMFGLGGGEIFIIALLAILLIGPKDLPKLAQQIGRWYRQFKNAVQDVKSTVEKEVSLEEDTPSKKSNP